MAFRACSKAVGAMCARGAGSSTSSLDQQREIPPLSRASGRIATPPFTPVLSESHHVYHRHAASERRRNRTCTPAFTPVLGPSDGARFVDAELDMGMMRSVRRVKRDSPDFIALRAEDGHEDSHEHKEAINIESIIHAEAMRRSADDEDSSDDDESEADFDVEDDEEYHGPQSSDNSDGDGDKEGDVGKKSIKVKQQVGTEEGAEEVRGAA